MKDIIRDIIKYTPVTLIGLGCIALIAFTVNLTGSMHVLWFLIAASFVVGSAMPKTSKYKEEDCGCNDKKQQVPLKPNSPLRTKGQNPMSGMDTKNIGEILDQAKSMTNMLDKLGALKDDDKSKIKSK